jgi:hypothetical protein
MQTKPDNDETHDEVRRGFDAGNYANAYESTDLESVELDCESDAYRAAFVLGFFASYELNEIPSDAREAFDSAYRSEFGAIVLAAGYCDSRHEDYQTEGRE